MAIIIPEQIIYTLVEGILLHVRKDIEDMPTDEQSVLYKIFGNLLIGRRSLFRESKVLFSRTQEQERHITVNLFYPKVEIKPPSVHIILPGEQSVHNELGVGETGLISDIEDSPGGDFYTPNYSRRFDSQIVVMVTSDNAQETLLIYHLLKAMFISIFDTIEFRGLENPVLSGRDLSNQEHLSPPHLFNRAIAIKHLHEITVPRFFDTQQINEIILKGIAQI